MHTHIVQNHKCHQHLNFLTRGKEVTPGTDRPLIFPPWEMVKGLSVNRFVFIYFCYSAVNRHERTHDKKQKHIHGRQVHRGCNGFRKQIPIQQCPPLPSNLLTLSESQRIILSLYLKQNQTNNKNSSFLSVGFPSCFSHYPPFFSFNPQLYPAYILKTCPTLGMQVICI